MTAPAPRDEVTAPAPRDDVMAPAPPDAAATPREPAVTFARLRLADWVAFVAALALLFTTAADWYSSKSGEEARRIEGLSQPSGAEAGQVEREVRQDASAAAEAEERNAWQATAAIDRLILIGLLATSALAVLAGFARAAGRSYGGALGPSTIAGLVAAVTALLVLYRLVQEPGFDQVNTVQAGAPLALAALGVIAYACARAVKAEEEEGAEPRQAEAPA